MQWPRSLKEVISDMISRRKKIHGFILCLSIFLFRILSGVAEANPCTVISEGASIVWKIGEKRIWRFPIAYEEEVLKMVSRFNDHYKKGFNLHEIRVQKVEKGWSLHIKDTPLLLARVEHSGPIRLSSKMMSLVWLSRIYDSVGEMHAHALSSKYELRGAHKLSGIVSWYGGEKMFGRKFANGERFEEMHLTAASSSLPFGTLVRVSRKDTNRNVVVRITDRFKEHKNRLLDISKAAAEVLDIKNKGLANVHVEVLGKVSQIGGK